MLMIMTDVAHRRFLKKYCWVRFDGKNFNGIVTEVHKDFVIIHDDKLNSDVSVPVAFALIVEKKEGGHN